ncbi:MAG TPA: DNA repair protein RecN [Acidothermaceae bacterium]|nr:DNA repair protein RecN [Acidothermaceae bacterium]
MLEELRISGLGVIDDAVLDLSPGLTVVTGETGAGKTMVVTGLGLLFGGRGDAGLVRTGSTRAAIDGRLRVVPGGPVASRVDELGGDLDDETLLLSRIIGADGRSRAQVGGRSVPVGTLAELADELIAVHGQTDQLRLRAPARQRDAIDRFGGDEVATPLTAYREVYRKYLDVETTLTELTERARDRAREAEVLRFGLAEIEKAAPQPSEDVALAAELGRLTHADALRSAAMSAHAGLLGDPAGDDIPDAVGLVAGARAGLERAADHDPALKMMADRLAEAGYVLSDVAADLAAYADDIDADPRRLAAAQDRQSVLAGLARKYAAAAGGTDDVIAWASEAGVRLSELDNDDSRLAELATESTLLRESMVALAAELSAARVATAQRFGDAVTVELRDLAMPHAIVSVDVSTGTDYGPHGADDIEVLLTPHPGAPARPLAKGASGGELSRVMLAVEVVFAGADPVPTFVFDEVDAGVGGRAAVEVGRRLARLARGAQVIVVTHLPQVAAFADRHLVVVKSNDGLVTRSGVIALDDAGRVNELSRMLAGLEGSSLAQGHAGELLATASGFKRDL